MTESCRIPNRKNKTVVSRHVSIAFVLIVYSITVKICFSKTDPEAEEQLIPLLENEIKLTEHCLLDNPKSYSSWHHRYWILQHHPKPNWQQIHC